MNAAISRLFLFVLALFALLIAFTSRWTVFEAGSLRDNDLNARHLLDELQVQRGTIRAADGTVLARSVRRDGQYYRTYPQGEDFSQAVGYFEPGAGIPPSGIEAEHNDDLSGQRSEFSSLLDELKGRQRIGDNVLTTLDPAAQRIALSALAASGGAKGGAGAVVALDPSTGAIKVMATIPSFDPNHTPKQRPKNGATQLTDFSPPGSTFKVVTAAAALDSGAYTPESVIDGKSPITVSGRPLQNDNGDSYGPISLTSALVNSVNTVFAQVALKVGRSKMTDYMHRFGFYSDPAIDYPRGQLDPSGELAKGRLISPTSDRVDLGRMGIGQDKLQATALQMAMVVSAVANGGVLMRPHLTDRVVDHDGRSVTTVQPKIQSTVMKSSSADELKQMMTKVVEEGTGQTVQLPGIAVAGKTGTAQIGVPGSNLTRPWFIALAPVDHPRIAIAVTVDQTTGGFGATVAAPIARAVLQQLLSHG